MLHLTPLDLSLSVKPSCTSYCKCICCQSFCAFASYLYLFFVLLLEVPPKAFIVLIKSPFGEGIAEQNELWGLHTRRHVFHLGPAFAPTIAHQSRKLVH